MLEELLDLSAGVGIVLLPLFMLALPAVILFVLLPAILLLALAAPVAVIVAVIAGPPYLLARWLRRRRLRTAKPRSFRTSGPSRVVLGGR
jgi:Flp pilus assembly protein TadB